MARYYVAGIPFDSRDALQHYGVKNMEWGKHKFGIDADDRYINYLNPSGSVKIFKQGNNAKIGYTDTGSRNGSKPTSSRVQVRPAAKVSIQKPKSGLQKAISDVGKTVSGAYNDASRWAGQAANDVRKALGTGVDFVTGKTAQNNATSARNAANIYANSAELKKDKLTRDLNATRNANAAAVQDAQSKFDQAKQNAANVNDYERMRVGGMADVYNSVPDARAAIAPEYTSRQNEARVNSVEANRQAAQARRDLDSARGQSGINQQQAENQARINMVNANRQAAQTQKAYEDAQRAYDTHPMTVAKDAINQAGNWIGDRANDVAKSGVGQWVSNAANDVGNAVSGAATQAGNWIGDRANDVGNAVSGAANQAGNWIGNRANDVAKSGVGQWVSNAANDVGNFVTGNQAKQNLENAKDSFFIGRNGRVANAQAEYDKTLPGMIENAGNWIGNRANDVAKSDAGQWVSNAANDVGQGAKGFIDSAGRWISGAANDVGNAVSGAANNIGSGAKGFINSAGQWVSNAANDVGNAASNAWNGVSNAAQDVGNWVSDRANDVGNAATNAYSDVSKAVSGNGVEADVSDRIAKKYGLNSIADVMSMDRETAKKMLKEYETEVSKAKDNSLFGHIGNAVNQAGTWIRDNAGNVVDEIGNLASEMVNPHYQIDPNRLREVIPEKLRHSDIDDKPEGVSDSFWKNYLAHGGTREQYDKDWAHL